MASKKLDVKGFITIGILAAYEWAKKEKELAPFREKLEYMISRKKELREQGRKLDLQKKLGFKDDRAELDHAYTVELYRRACRHWDVNKIELRNEVDGYTIGTPEHSRRLNLLIIYKLI